MVEACFLSAERACYLPKWVQWHWATKVKGGESNYGCVSLNDKDMFCEMWQAICHTNIRVYLHKLR